MIMWECAERRYWGFSAEDTISHNKDFGDVCQQLYETGTDRQSRRATKSQSKYVKKIKKKTNKYVDMNIRS